MAERDSNTIVTPRRIVAVVVIALFVIFMAQNRAATSVQFMLFDVSGPLWLTLLMTFVIGAAAAWLLFGRRRRT